jgi:hypothetical protein
MYNPRNRRRLQVLILILGVLFINNPVSAGLYDLDLYATPLGLSGAIFSPSPYTRRLNEGSMLYSGNFFDQKDQSTLISDRASRHFVSFSAGIQDQIEVALSQEFFTGSADQRSRFYWSMKYQIPSDSIPIGISAIFPASRVDYFSVAASIGWKPFYFGVGGNYGGETLRETNLLAGREFGVAQFGGYRMRRIPSSQNSQPSQLEVIGSPDEFFGFVGGQVSLGRHVQWLYDYDGDVFASGFRVNMDTSTFQIAYLTAGDYDTLFNRKQDNIIASAQYRF